MVAFLNPPPFMSVRKRSMFVSVSSGMTASSSINWASMSVQAGDLAIAVCYSTGNLTLTGWTALAPSSNFQGTARQTVNYKIISSSDVSATESLTIPSSSTCFIVVYRGGSTLTRKTSAAGTTTSITTSGFVKDANSLKVLGLSGDRDGGVILGAPTGFTNRLSETVGLFSTAISDIDPANYVNSASVVFPMNPSGSFGGIGALLEIT